MIMSGTPGLAPNDKVALSAKGPAQCIICMKPSLPALSQSLGTKVFQDIRSMCCTPFQRSQTRVCGGQHILSAKVRGRKRVAVFLHKQILVMISNGSNAKSVASAMHANNHLLSEHENH